MDIFDMSDLSRWLLDETEKRDLSMRQASLQAGLDHGAVSRFVKGTVPSPESCERLADFFNVPHMHVMELAGHVHLPPSFPDLDEESQAILVLLGRVNSGKREHLIRQILTLIKLELTNP